MEVHIRERRKRDTSGAMVNEADCAAYVWARKKETHRTPATRIKKEDEVALCSVCRQYPVY